MQDLGVLTWPCLLQPRVRFACPLALLCLAELVASEGVEKVLRIVITSGQSVGYCSVPATCGCMPLVSH